MKRKGCTVRIKTKSQKHIYCGWLKLLRNNQIALVLRIHQYDKKQKLIYTFVYPGSVENKN